MAPGRVPSNRCARGHHTRGPTGGTMTTATDVLVEIEQSIHVEDPPDTVWSCVCDISRHPQYAGPKSITKLIEFDGEIVPGARWLAHEKFGPQKFDAPSEITEVVPGRHLAWVS